MTQRQLKNVIVPFDMQPEGPKLFREIAELTWRTFPTELEGFE
jgi:hypothetical protein